MEYEINVVKLAICMYVLVFGFAGYLKEGRFEAVALSITASVWVAMYHMVTEVELLYIGWFLFALIVAFLIKIVATSSSRINTKGSYDD